MFQQTAKELIAFIEKSPTCFQAVATMKETLKQEGYQELKENEKWQIEKGGNYFVTEMIQLSLLFQCHRESGKASVLWQATVIHHLSKSKIIRK